jgi:hypothetical protein
MLFTIVEHFKNRDPLHSSSASIQPFHRRVIHIEYAAIALPEGLEWFNS